MNEHFIGPRCPRCSSRETRLLGRTLAGRRYLCGGCGESWGVSLEDEVLGMIVDAKRSRSSPDGGSQSGSPEST